MTELTAVAAHRIRTARTRSGPQVGTVALRVVATTVWAAAWALPTAALVLTAAYRLPIIEAGPFMIMYLVLAYVQGPVAAVLVLRRPGPAAVILTVFAVGCGLAAFGYQYELADLLGRADLPAVGFVGHTLASLWYLGMYLVLTTLPWYLTGPRTRAGRTAAALGAAVSAVAFLTRWLWQFPGAAPNPLAVADPGWQRALAEVYAVANDAAFVLAAAATAALTWTAVTGPAARRRPRRWLAAGQGLLTVTIGAAFFSPVSLPRDVIFGVLPFPPLVALLFLPVSLLVVVLGERLAGIDVAVARTAVWALLFTVVVVGYASVVLWRRRGCPAWLAGRAPGPRVVPRQPEQVVALVEGEVQALRDRGDHLLRRLRPALALKPGVVVRRHVAEDGHLLAP